MTVYYKVREHAVAFHSPRNTEMFALDTYLRSCRVTFRKLIDKTTTITKSEFLNEEANIKSFLNRSHIVFIQVPVE
jgi:hypothetical protein